MKLANLSNGLAVLLNETVVGNLALNRDGRAVFQYSTEWLETGFSINPYSLPLSSEVFVPDWRPFNGLFGVFFDSLPDGWGALLLDRKMRAEGINPHEVDSLTRLAIVGSSGRGALSYKPHVDFSVVSPTASLDDLARWCNDILADRPIDDLDAVYAAGGSSGGARPKAYVEDDEGSWLVKFPSGMDPEGIGLLEYDYMLAAQECGIAVPDFKLLPSQLCEGYFATKRFDVGPDGTRVHMVSASGIVEVTHREPSLDYESLFQISAYLGGGRSEAKRLYRLMCFNVFAHNQDDHSNNFTWLCNGGEWSLSPAYDLTYSTSFGNAHATSVLGVGNPGMDDVLALAKEVGLPQSWSFRTAEAIKAVCHDLLASHKLLQP